MSELQCDATRKWPCVVGTTERCSHESDRAAQRTGVGGRPLFYFHPLFLALASRRGSVTDIGPELLVGSSLDKDSSYARLQRVAGERMQLWCRAID